MFIIRFKNSRFVSDPIVRTSDSIDDALGFALSLHKSSNVPHVISVFDGDDRILLLELADNGGS